MGPLTTFSFSADGDIGSISISGDLYVYSGGNIGNLSGDDVSRQRRQHRQHHRHRRCERECLRYLYGGGSGYWSAASNMGVIGNIDADGDVTGAMGAKIGTIDAGGDIGSVSAFDVDSKITAGGSIDSVTASRDVTAEITANGGDIGRDDFWSTTGIEAGRNILGTIHASGQILKYTRASISVVPALPPVATSARYWRGEPLGASRSPPAAAFKACPPGITSRKILPPTATWSRLTPAMISMATLRRKAASARSRLAGT